jgi:hypothetical protein
VSRLPQLPEDVLAGLKQQCVDVHAQLAGSKDAAMFSQSPLGASLCSDVLRARSSLSPWFGIYDVMVSSSFWTVSLV